MVVVLPRQCLSDEPPPFLRLEIFTTVTSSLAKSSSVSEDRQSSCKSGALSTDDDPCCCWSPEGPGRGLLRESTLSTVLELTPQLSSSSRGRSRSLTPIAGGTSDEVTASSLTCVFLGLTASTQDVLLLDRLRLLLGSINSPDDMWDGPVVSVADEVAAAVAPAAVGWDLLLLAARLVTVTVCLMTP